MLVKLLEGINRGCEWKFEVSLRVNSFWEGKNLISGKEGEVHKIDVRV